MKRKYRVEVAFQGERYVTVTAENERQAHSKARAKVRGMKIGRSIRPDWTDTVWTDPDY